MLLVQQCGQHSIAVIILINPSPVGTDEAGSVNTGSLGPLQRQRATRDHCAMEGTFRLIIKAI